MSVGDELYVLLGSTDTFLFGLLRVHQLREVMRCEVLRLVVKYLFVINFPGGSLRTQ